MILNGRNNIAVEKNAITDKLKIKKSLDNIGTVIYYFLFCIAAIKFLVILVQYSIFILVFSHKFLENGNK